MSEPSERRPQLQHVLHRCADCKRTVSKEVGNPLVCSCGGSFVIDTKYRPDLVDQAADQRAELRQRSAAAVVPAKTNGKHHPIFACETCKDSKIVIVGLINGVGAANRPCPDCEVTAVGT